MNKFSHLVFFGFAEATPDSEEYRFSYEVGRLAALENYTCVSGGFGGVMESSLKGAKEANGKTLAVTFYPAGDVIFSGGRPNPYADSEIKTSTYLERTLKMIEVGDAYFIFNGATGTLSEFGMVWALAKIYYSIFKPLIFVGTNWRPLITSLEKHMRNRPVEREVYAIAETPQEAIAALHMFEKKKAQHAQQKYDVTGHLFSG